MNSDILILARLYNTRLPSKHLQLIGEMFTGSPIFRYNIHADKLHLDI